MDACTDRWVMRAARLARRVGADAAGAIVATLLLAVALPLYAAATPPVAWVNVSVATLWRSPSLVRPVDWPALGNPVDMHKWIADMTLAQNQWVSNHNAIETQALYGQKVYVLQRKGDWDQIAVPGQLTPKNVLGYPGWVPDVQLTRRRALAPLQSKPFAMVDAAPTVWLYDDAALTKKFLRVSFDTRLPVLRRTAAAVEVATPDGGPKWFAASAVTVFNTAADIPKPDAAALIKTGKLFMGLPYLWGGRSGFMLDCSGFTSLVYASHGVTITRDAVPMVAATGAVRTRSQQLRPGDLIYYAHDHGTGSTYHIAMYIGHGRMMESYTSGVPVRTTAVRFGKDYWGAEQVLGTPAATASWKALTADEHAGDSHRASAG